MPADRLTFVAADSLASSGSGRQSRKRASTEICPLMFFTPLLPNVGKPRSAGALGSLG